MHAELTHAAVDGEHGLEDAVAAGEALIINADEGHGRVNEDALRVLLVQKNYGTRHSLIVRSHAWPEGEDSTRPRSYRGRYARHAEGAVLSTLLQGHPSSLRFGHPDVAYG